MVGVSDKGLLTGTTRAALDQSLLVIRRMTDELDANVIVVKELVFANNRWSDVEYLPPPQLMEISYSGNTHLWVAEVCVTKPTDSAEWHALFTPPVIREVDSILLQPLSLEPSSSSRAITVAAYMGEANKLSSAPQAMVNGEKQPTGVALDGAAISFPANAATVTVAPTSTSSLLSATQIVAPVPVATSSLPESEVRVAVCGPVDAGKSTLLGVLTSVSRPLPILIIASIVILFVLKLMYYCCDF
jgi:hypothetical protein